MLIGHFLGVDHAGHTFGGERGMRRKIKQRTPKAVVAAMAWDDAFDRALLIVMREDLYGMTMHGDHGGGTPEETDSFLFAYRRAAATAAADRQRRQRGEIARRTFDVRDDASDRFRPHAVLFQVPIPF